MATPRTGMTAEESHRNNSRTTDVLTSTTYDLVYWYTALKATASEPPNNLGGDINRMTLL